MSDSLFFQEPCRSLSPLGALVAAFAQLVKIAFSADRIGVERGEQRLDTLVSEFLVVWPKDLELDALFQITNNKVQLRSSSAKRYASCMDGIRRIFVACASERGLLTTEQINKYERRQLSFSNVRLEIFASRKATEDQKRLVDVVFAFTNFKIMSNALNDLKLLYEADGIRWNERLEFFGLLTSIHDATKEKDARFSNIQTFVTKSFEYIFLEHQLAKAVATKPLFGLSLASLCMRCSVPLSHDSSFENRNAGAYFVYRKARSGVAGDDALIDLIVRDFVWLRPGFWEANENYVGVDSNIPSGALGYYFSAVDRQVYEITAISRRDRLLMLDAVAHLSGNQTKSLCLYMGELKAGSDSQFSYGGVLGTIAGSGQPGSWSVVVVRPKIERTFIHVLNACLETYLTSLVVSDQLLERVNYDTAIENVYAFVTGFGLCGVYYSEMWANGAEVDRDFWYCVPSNEMVDRRDAFHRLFLRTARQEEVLEKYVSRLLNRSALNFEPFREHLTNCFNNMDIEAALDLFRTTAFALIKAAIVENHTITSTPARNHAEIKRRLDDDQVTKKEQFMLENENFLFSVLQMTDARFPKVIEFGQYRDLCIQWRTRVIAPHRVAHFES